MAVAAPAGVLLVNETDIGRSETAFRFSIDEGSERRLYLSGGTRQGPERIRLTRDSATVIDRATVLLALGTLDV